MRDAKNKRSPLRRIGFLVSLAAACGAIVWAAKQASAASEGSLGEMLGLPAARTAPLATLSPADVARYRQIFALQQEARFGEAQRITQQVDSDLLMGHVLAQRYLHRKSAKTSYEELTGWLQRYADLPQALRIHRLAVSRAPRKAAPPPVPDGGYLEGAGQELKEESFSDSFMRRWNVGITAWRHGDYGGAADQFMALAKDPDRGGEELAAAAFWAGRAQLRARRPELVAGLLRKAARASDEFYGLLAQRLLDERIRFDWRREELRQEMVQLLVRYPAAKRAIALRQAGQLNLAEAEVRRLGGRTALPEDTRALTALAATLELPSAQMRLAQQLRLADGRRHDGAMFPIPRWEPQSGFRLDRTLVYAIVRAESAFDIEAESPRGALGLMQVMPDTGALVAKGAKIAYNGPDDLLEPDMNLEIGQTWLRRLMRTDTVDNSLVHLIVAYNAGETRLKGWLDGDLKRTLHDPLLFIESVPIAESRGYAKKVLGNLWAYQIRLGQATPSLQALAENRWPTITALDPSKGVGAREQAAKASGKTVATAGTPAAKPVAEAKPKPAVKRVAKAAQPAKPATAKKAASAPARRAVRKEAAMGSLGTLRISAGTG